LGRDIGTDHSVFGHLTALRRIRIGDFELDRAVSLPEDLDAPPGELISLAETAGTLLPVVRVGAAQAKALMQGKTVSAADLGPQAPGTVAVVCEDTLVSVAEVRYGGGLKSLTAFAIDLA